MGTRFSLRQPTKKWKKQYQPSFTRGSLGARMAQIRAPARIEERTRTGQRAAAYSCLAYDELELLIPGLHIRECRDWPCGPGTRSFCRASHRTYTRPAPRSSRFKKLNVDQHRHNPRHYDNRDLFPHRHEIPIFPKVAS
jgi:hypothetical protein